MSTTTAIFALTKPTNLGDSGVWGAPVDTNFDVIDDVMARPKIVQNAPTYNVAGTTTLDCALARVFVFTVSGASTLAFSNVPSATFAVNVQLVITNGGAFVLSFPASVTWLGGVAPTLKASGVDVVDLVTRDGGTTWFGSPRGASNRTQVGTSTTLAKPTQVLWTTNGGTGSTVEASLASFSLPANSLVNNADAIRLKLYGNATAFAGQLRVKFGATYVLNVGGGNNLGVGSAFQGEVMVRRSGAAAQLSGAALLVGTAVASTERGAPAETLSGAVTVDVRGNTSSGGGAVNLDLVSLEVLAA